MVPLFPLYGQNSQYFTSDSFQPFNVSTKSYKYVNISSEIVVEINDLICVIYVITTYLRLK